MELESYFNFVADDAIRLKDTRVGIETILHDYLLGVTPEEILIRYPTLSLQQIYATITYYLIERETLDLYLERIQLQRKEAWDQQQRCPSEFVQSLRERLARQRHLFQRERTFTYMVDE